MKMYTAPIRAGLIGITLLMSANSAFAADKLYSPYVTPGELELEYFGSRSFDDSSSKNNEQKQQFAVAYGVTDYWKTELYAKFEKEAQDRLRFEEWEWENIFQLTEQGEYWVDVGAALAYEWTPQADRKDTAEARLLFAKDIGKTFHLLNLKASKKVGSGNNNERLKGKVLWSSRYSYDRYFEPGFEIESDFGQLSRTGGFEDQKHYIGPAAYGKIPLNFTDRADGLKYRVGYLFGVSNAADDGQAIAQLEYEIHF